MTSDPLALRIASLDHEIARLTREKERLEAQRTLEQGPWPKRAQIPMYARGNDMLKIAIAFGITGPALLRFLQLTEIILEVGIRTTGCTTILRCDGWPLDRGKEMPDAC